MAVSAVLLAALFGVPLGAWLALAAGFGRCLAEVGAALMVGGDIPGHTRTLTTAIVLETGKGKE